MTTKVKKVKKETEPKEVAVIDPKIEAEIAEIKQTLAKVDEVNAMSKLTRTQIELIKTQFARGTSDDELKVFLMTCVRTGLDPFAKQIYFVKRWDTKTGRDIFTPQASIDGLRSIAERSGNYAGNDDPTFDDEKTPQKATVSIYKIVQNQRVAFTATARWSQYCSKKGMDFMWKKMPHLMLGKCAEALALRKAFPNVIGGLYITEEMEQAMPAEQKRAEAVQKTMKLDSLDLMECYEYKEKMQKSDKYSAEDKKKILATVDGRIKELEAQDAQESK